MAEETPLLGTNTNDNAGESKLEDKKPVDKNSQLEMSKTGEETMHWKVRTLLIVLTEMCERMAFFCISSGMVIFCTNVLLYSSVEAVTFNLVFIGMSYFLPVFGGWIADSIAGRYNTIYGGMLIYTAGTSLLVLVTLDYATIFKNPLLGLNLNYQRGFFITAIVMVCFGMAGLKSNVSAFGAEQVQDAGNNMIRTFFNWFYWFINVGSGLAFTLLAYIQQEISFAVGYLVVASAMLLSVVLFLIPRSSYKKSPPQGSVMARQQKLIYTAVKSRLQRKDDTTKLPSFLDYASDQHGGLYPEIEVEGVRSQFRMLPIFFTGVFYACTYAQVTSTFILQGERLNLQVGSFTMPVVSLTMFHIMTVLILIPLVDRVFLPLLAKCHLRPTSLQRIGFGYFLGVLSLMAAAGLEIIRKQDIAENGVLQQEVAGVLYNSSHISVFAQAPQYALSGAGEIFASIAGLEFAYSQAPRSLQGVLIGMYLVTTGAGAFLGSAILNIANSVSAPNEWIPNEINDGHVEYYFLLLASINLITLLIFILYTKFVFQYASYSIVYDVKVQKPAAGYGTLDATSSHESQRLESGEQEEDTSLVTV